MRAKLETKIAAGALLTVLVIGAVCVLSYQRVREANETSRMVAHTYEALTQLNAAVGTLTDAEAGVRGYLLTGQTSYLGRQERNFIVAHASLQYLAALIHDNPVQQTRLASLRQKFDEKIAFLKEAIELRRSGGVEPAQLLFESGRGRETMQDVRQIASAMEKTERELLGQRQRRAAESAANTVTIVVIAGLLDALLLALAVITIRREMHARQQLEEELRRDAERLTAVVNTQSQIVQTELDLNRVMQIVTERAQELTGAMGASIDLVEGDRLVPRAATGSAKSASGVPGESLAKLTADCFERDEAIVCDDLGAPGAAIDSTVASDEPASAGAQARSAILVPLRSSGRACGVLKVFSQNVQAFSPTDAKGLELIAGFVAAAMSNASAYEGRQQLIQDLTAVNEELESFSYSVSHDLRAPLRHISGFGDLLRQQLGGLADEKASRYLTVIGESTRHMGLLIDELLAFARVGRAELQRSKFELAPLVQAVIHNLQGSVDGREIDWQVGPLPEVEADAGMMRQVFTNLIDNALKYTRPRARTVIEIGARPNDGELLFYVRDNGVGFDPQYAGKLFGVFQRLHQAEEFEGTGIGLANVRRVIQKHGGRTWAEAELDTGATFYFTLPLTKTS
jgi:signal transduction histidine kinase/CHASE3 domain sensor protein